MKMEPLKKTAFISGIYGQDAFYLRRKLLNQGYNVIGATRAIKEEISIESDINIIQTDYSKTHLEKILMDNEIDIIFHLCGQSKVGLSWIHVEETINSQANIAINFVQIINEKKLPIKLINSSSSEIFASQENTLIDENSVFKPINPYGVAQLFSYNVCQIFRDKYNMFISNAILFPHESKKRPKFFVTKKIISTLNKISKGEIDKLSLGNIDVIRDWGHADDYMDALILIAQHDKPDDYCICTSHGMSVREILEYTLDVFDLDFEKHVTIDNTLKRYKEHNCIIGDNSKIKKQLGWEPKYFGKKLIDKLIKEQVESERELKSK